MLEFVFVSTSVRVSDEETSFGPAFKGAVYNFLEPFAACDVNLTCNENTDKHMPHTAWQYCKSVLGLVPLICTGLENHFKNYELHL